MGPTNLGVEKENSLRKVYYLEATFSTRTGVLAKGTLILGGYSSCRRRKRGRRRRRENRLGRIFMFPREVSTLISRKRRFLYRNRKFSGRNVFIKHLPNMCHFQHRKGKREAMAVEFIFYKTHINR